MIHRHHVIPKHEWKLRFPGEIDLESYNAPDNVVWLSITQHAQVHGFLFELNGNEYDKIAQVTLAGTISIEEAHRQAIVFANKGKKHTEETKEKMRRWHTGRPKSLTARQALSRAKMGVPMSQAHKDACAKGHIGRKASVETRLKQSLAQRGRVMERIVCIHCQKAGAKALINRWHNNHCRHKDSVLLNEILSLRKNGLSFRQIADILKISTRTIGEMKIPPLAECVNGFYIKQTCPHCKIEGGGPIMFRYHFNNCKENHVTLPL